MSNRSFRRICVFCGARNGERDSYRAAAEHVGRLIANEGKELVYGGGSIGLMGVVADAALAAGGSVIGVIPKQLSAKEITHAGLTELRIVDSMHERKFIMGELSDAFVTLPGGYGTLDELFEVLTWAQLGEHDKPTGLVNIEGYFDPLLTMIDRMIEEGFLKPKYRELFLVDDGPDRLLKRFAEYKAPEVKTWIGPAAR